MANPHKIKIKEGTVVKVATNITSGVINRTHLNKPDMTFTATYRITGYAEPTVEEMRYEEQIIFDKTNQTKIDSSFAIDVYLSCNNADSDSNDWGEVIMWI